MSIPVVRLLALAGAVAILGLVSACQHLAHHQPLPGEVVELDGCYPDQDCPGCDPKVCKKGTVHALAHDLDHLEKHIDWFGSVVPKVPDIWGQARLSEHRQEFELQMKGDLGEFRETLQGTLSRADQSYVLQSVALSAAISGPVAVRRIPRGTVINETGKPTTEVTQQVLSAPTAVAPGIVGAVKADGTPATVASDLNNPNFFVPAPQVNAARYRTSVEVDGAGGAKTSQLAISLEPALYLEQKARYLNYLNQIRRTNEGDDISDAPGYSLNLVRIPVSVLPGKRTDAGFGAEITMTLEPVLGEELLPTTFRSLVVNDLAQQMGLPVVKFLEEERWSPNPLLKEDDESHFKLQGLDLFQEFLSKETPEEVLAFLVGRSEADMDRLLAVTGLTSFRQVVIDLNQSTAMGRPDELQERRWLDYGRAFAEASKKFAREESTQRMLQANRKRLESIKLPALSFASGLENKLPFPSSHLVDVYGMPNWFEIVHHAEDALASSFRRQNYYHLPELHAYLREEVTAAHRLLREHPELMSEFCNPELVRDIRTMRVDNLRSKRITFRDRIRMLSESGQFNKRLDKLHPPEYSQTAALAWCVVVDSALLTDRLIRDITETGSARNRPIPACGDWAPFFLPDPPPDTRAVFNEYVKLRWPIRVFALDPVTQDQNLADSLTTRRETQLALAMGFLSGRISANTMTRYARRLEAQYETIALNRTQVGFSHGENVFGWRFYPRFQTPPTESNLSVLVRDQIIGGPNTNQLLRDRRLEPGMRECVAIVLMPSFVPYVTVDSTANWFPLPNPKRKVLDHTQAMRMSRTVRSLEMCGLTVTDADCYRDGELRRLQQRVAQLASRLPTQTSSTQVPVLNTLGGFEMFNNGVTDLAPELYGFYGAPGVERGAVTQLFLVGDHFSTLHTRVIVGNREAKHRLLSRQVMVVDVDGAAIPFSDQKEPFVRAHVATPYGVTREIDIPLTGPAPTAAGPAYTLNQQVLTVFYTRKVNDADKTFTLVAAGIETRDSAKPDWVISVNDRLGVVPTGATVTLTPTTSTGPQDPLPLTSQPIPIQNGNQFVILKDTLGKVAENWINRINKTATAFPAETDIDRLFTGAGLVRLTPVYGTATGHAVDVAPRLTIVFREKK